MLHVMACERSRVGLDSGSVWLAVDSGVATVRLAKAHPVSSIEIRRNLNLDRLICSPKDLPNNNKAVMIILRFLEYARVIMVMSSANCSTVVEIMGKVIKS
jgi:predicted neuraminidase